ncbi:hypothetical protein PBT90_06655 [Algoriphagus halophytocola]|uniref:DUF4221 domain-containing protein n=1 Tax=Algoriphagus halophytocola TaxID=2991499 RepID=A0ABY6MHI0_9BACT|nr:MULTISPECIES: hypothetical protein [unclassified Algoriphagus]UZD23073.1 hypothetical protein OM944_00975 [Algoriphagus sp. TR-M5]WBL44365.1 hypothetical protein PBT90_06655 [Algoriphagus sp. TR-M9]
MKHNLSYLFTFTLTVALFSCGKQSSVDSSEKKSFSFEITDSLQVDYLGEMMLLDYDPKAEKYLLATNSYYEYLEVDEQGKILNHNSFSEDGINAVGQALGLGYFNGDVTVFNPPKGYYRFQDSTKVGEVNIPYPHQVFMMYPKLGMFESGDKIYYPKPWPESLDVNLQEGEFYQALLHLPIIEAQDKASGDTLGALRLPESSPLLEDEVNGFPIPVYSMDGDKLLLSMWFEPTIYVYNKVGDKFEYEQTVSVDIPDWVPTTSVPLDQAEQFFAENQKKVPGNLTNILVTEEYYLAIYNRGLTEAQKTALGSPTDGGLSRRRMNPNFAAVFDKNFNQLASNVPIPIASNFPMVVNADGELVVSKIAGLSETEDDGIVLYKLKLTKK